MITILCWQLNQLSHRPINTTTPKTVADMISVIIDSAQRYAVTY